MMLALSLIQWPLTCLWMASAACWSCLASLMHHIDSTPAATVCISSIYQSISHLTPDLREIRLKRPPRLPCRTTPTTPELWLWWHCVAAPFVCGWACHARRKGHSSAICSTQSHSCPLPPLISTGWRCNCWASQDTRRGIQDLPAPTLSPAPWAHLYKLEEPKKKKKTG